MKQFIILTLALSFFCLKLHAQAEKTLVKSVDLNGNIAITAALNGHTTISEWDKDFIRITTHVKLTNSNESILERLVSVGRYEISLDEVDGVMTLTMPKASTAVVLKGTSLVEQYSFEITVPKKISIKIDAPASEGI